METASVSQNNHESSAQNQQGKRPWRRRRPQKGNTERQEPQGDGNIERSRPGAQNSRLNQQDPGSSQPGNGSSSAQSGPNSGHRRHPPRRNPRDTSTEATSNSRPESSTSNTPGGPGNAKPAKSPTKSRPPAQRPKNHTIPAYQADDLTSSLIHDLSTHPYPDCPICFAAIRPEQPTWSCSPYRNETVQCCWTTFHLKCIRSWSAKSVKEVADAWRARGEDRRGEWRCPGCQLKREAVPSGYMCFCGSTPEPKPPRLATPHSCASPCSRPRACGHPCSLSCHPGPCPPCQIIVRPRCHCGKQMLAFKCSHITKQGVDTELSCGKACGKKLSCGNHVCESECHTGECGACQVRESVRCYCGRVEREVACGEGRAQECALNGQESWTGRFDCGNTCERAFDCGKHFCKKTCHPPSRLPPPCPTSPSLVTHCPCGKHALVPSSTPSFSPGAVLLRTSCSDPIPTCMSTCMKPLAGCNHVCSAKCHIGPCPPCSIMLVRPCRCGTTKRDVRCSDAQMQDLAHGDILCDKPCTALRACGRHQCNRLCCPLASLASAKGKGKRRTQFDGAMDDTGLHECDLVCGKLLGCGNHYCEEKDHKGACPPCLRSSFEELYCYCGRTFLEPPIPCGTRINCSYPCSRPEPACGHPKSTHSCHEDPIPCPPCPFLTSKVCSCGKKSVPNIRCSQEKVSCGTICGKLMACGFHHCERPCHGGDCGACAAVCGKPRKLCLPAHHACALPCHAPASCLETEPCHAMITLTCPCGRIRQSVKCGRSNTSPGREATQQLKCSNECNIAKRNARLAEALGINPQSREKTIVYNEELTLFARANTKFLSLVERSFAEFIPSEKKTQVLPHMPMDRRKFVHDLASVYRMDTQMVDQEPHRSVQLIRRIDSRVPSPLLSASIATSTTPSLGKLADLRASPRPISPAPVKTVAGPRDWTSVVNQHPGSSLGSTATTVTSNRNARPLATQPAISPALSIEVTDPQDVPDSWEDDT